MNAYWYRGERNFGDALTEILFRELAGIDLSWSRPEQARLFGAGSILQRVPPGYTGIVFGSGILRRSQTADVSMARVLALRGPQTALRAGTSCDLYCDPGLLASMLRRRPARRIARTGVVPHYADDELRKRWSGKVINVLDPVHRVIEEVASCSRVVTSSLHVLILADALGIENRLEPSKAVVGEGFKFRDYAESFDEVLRPHVWRLADQTRVREKQALLLDRMNDVPRT